MAGEIAGGWLAGTKPHWAISSGRSVTCGPLGVMNVVP